jgi:hypothetical protein
VTNSKIKITRSEARHSELNSSLAGSGFLDDSVLTAIRHAAARLNPRQSPQKPSVGRHAGPVKNRASLGRQAPPRHAAA